MQTRLETKRLIVRPLTQRDLGPLIRYLKRNQKFHKPYEPTQPLRHYSAPFWIKRIRQRLKDFRLGKEFHFGLFPKETPSQIIGTIGYGGIIRGPLQSAFLGYAMDQQFHGQGLMYEALQATNRFMFIEQNLHRLQAAHLPRNKRSEALLLKLGFKDEGLARKYLKINGKWRDHKIKALINKSHK